MLRLFRVRACCLATAVLLAVGTTTAAFEELLHAGEAHDAACAPALLADHDASSHRVQTPDDTNDGAGHCVACHLARAPRLGTQSASLVGHVDNAAIPRPAPTIGSARAAALAGLPPRSPPPLS